MTAVTALISTYQRPDACARALDSVLAQDPAPGEVLICDDGSTDETAAWARSWEDRDPRVRYLRSEPNTGGPATARNLGLRAARGEWVAFLDDDDEWLPGKLARQLAVISSADVVAANARTSDGRLYFPDLVAPRDAAYEEVLAANPVIQSTALARRSALLAAGGFPEARWLNGLEDYAAWLELSRRGGRIVVLPEPLVVYAVHDEGRLSAAPVGVERRLARLAWQRAARHPLHAGRWRNALNRTAGAARTARRHRDP